MLNKTKSLKEMCEKFSVTPRTLRYYEYIELLAPEKRGRTRLYGSRECARMKLIMSGRRFGFSLEDVRQWLELYDKDPKQTIQMQDLLNRGKTRLEDLNKRRVELDEVILELNDLMEVAKKSLARASVDVDE